MLERYIWNTSYIIALRVWHQMKPCCLAVMSANSFALITGRQHGFIWFHTRSAIIYDVFHIYLSLIITYHGKLWTQKWPAPNVSGFIAQLVRASHRYREDAGSNPIEVLKNFRLLDACGARKLHCQTGEFQIKFHSKNRYRNHRFVIHAISVFSVKFTVEFTSQAMNFSLEESKENDLIIKTAIWNIKTPRIRNLLFSLTLRAVRINNQGAPLLGLAKSIY